MSPRGARPAAMHEKTMAAAEGRAKCLMPSVLPAVVTAKSLSSPEVTGLFIAVIVFQIKDKHKKYAFGRIFIALENVWAIIV